MNTRDTRETLYWLEKAANAGSGFAAWLLGQYYESGLEVEQSYAKAIKYYRIAAESDDTGADDARQRLNRLMK